MKLSYLLLLALFPLLISAGDRKVEVDKDLKNVTVYYCIENPMYAGGPENAHSYLEIGGMKDRTLQQQLNDSLKMITLHGGILTKFTGGVIRRTLKRPFGKRYSARSCVYGTATVKFRLLEKVRRYTAHEINKGHGLYAPICYFGWFITRGHFLFVSDGPVMDLRNGTRIKPMVQLVVQPERLDTFRRYMSKYSINRHWPGSNTHCDTTNVANDTIILEGHQFSRYLLTDSCSVGINMSCSTAPPTKENRWTVYLSLREIEYFLEPDFRETIEKTFQ